MCPLPWVAWVAHACRYKGWKPTSAVLPGCLIYFAALRTELHYWHVAPCISPRDTRWHDRSAARRLRLYPDGGSQHDGGRAARPGLVQRGGGGCGCGRLLYRLRDGHRFAGRSRGRQHRRQRGRHPAQWPRLVSHPAQLLTHLPAQCRYIILTILNTDTYTPPYTHTHNTHTDTFTHLPAQCRWLITMLNTDTYTSPPCTLTMHSPTHTQNTHTMHTDTHTHTHTGPTQAHPPHLTEARSWPTEVLATIPTHTDTPRAMQANTPTHVHPTHTHHTTYMPQNTGQNPLQPPHGSSQQETDPSSKTRGRTRSSAHCTCDAPFFLLAQSWNHWRQKCQKWIAMA